MRVTLLLLLSIPWIVAETPSSTPDTPTETSTAAPNAVPTAAPTVAPVDVPTTQAPPPPIPAVKFEQYTFDKGPVHELHGSYSLMPEKNHDTGRPGWASIWSIHPEEQHFGVYFWPPKYCHAVYVCPVKAKQYDKNGMNKFDEFECDEMYIKYYPHIHKLFFKKAASAEEPVAFYVEPSLQFQRLSGTDNFTLTALKSKPVDHEGWIKMKTDKTNDVTFTWNLDGKSLLILTNSRMCEIHKPGFGFTPIFDSTQKKVDSANWPKWLVKEEQGNEHVATVTLPATGGGKKTIDLLAYLRDLTPATTNKLGDVEQRCGNYEKVGTFGSRKPVYEHSVHVSTASYVVYQPSLSVASAWTMKLEFSINNCQWIRFWATDKQMSEYKTEMKIEDTLDLFLQEGFFIPPDSDTPVALPDSQMIDRIQFTILRKPAGATHPQGLDDHELIEFAFGSVNNVYLFRQFFKSESFGKKNFNLHMIRSPKCESNIILDNPFGDDSMNAVVNLKDVKSCSYSYLIDPNDAAKPST